MIRVLEGFRGFRVLRGFLTRVLQGFRVLGFRGFSRFSRVKAFGGFSRGLAVV